MNRTRSGLLMAAASLVFATTIYAGGWAVITVDDLPEYVTATEPVTLTYTVRQHGAHALSGLTGRVEARAGGTQVVASARPGKHTGHYAATLTLPTAGEWTITINSGFAGLGTLTLLPLKVVDRTARPSPLAVAERGRQLFVAKGCATCHTMTGADFAPAIRQAPALVPHKYQSEYLARILANPALIPSASGTFRMPNLSLDQPEIDALVAFINPARPADTKTIGRK